MCKNKDGYSFRVPCPPYDVDVIVSIKQSDKDFKKLLKKEINKDYHHSIPKSFIGELACCVKFDNGQCAIRFTLDPDINTLTHEVFHAAYAMFTTIGMKLSRDSEEAFAYFIGYLSEQIFNGIKK